MAQTMSGQWNYPLEETNGNARHMGTRRDTGGSQESRSMRRVPSDAWNVMSDSEGTKQRRASLKATNVNAGRKRSRNTLREKKMERPTEQVDDSAWIHRDKLHQIEIMEMEEAGIPVPASRRSMSAGPDANGRRSGSQSRSTRSINKDQVQEQRPEEEYGIAYGGEEEEYPRKRISTIPAADEEEENFDPNTDYEFRTPRELAVERESIRSLTRPATSRIPVSKASPVPVPSTVVGRESPLPRSRHGSASYSGTWDDMQYARKARSGSMGSQAILDDEEGMQTPSRPNSSNIRSSAENSPGKARVPGKATPSSRKGSVQNGTVRPGSSSGLKAHTTPAKDRTPSAGHRSRPSTSHAYNPEGEPPWIASMYKPDPRLPPDQQMLPTHKKRMMQEQWEKEGKTGTTYDRDLRLINDEELPPPTKASNPSLPPQPNFNRQKLEPLKVPSPSPSPKPQLQQQNSSHTSPNSTNMDAWPLTPASNGKSEPPSPRPGTSGGYKITPTIASPPQIQRREASPAPPMNQTPRVPDLDEKEEVQSKQGGCGCCVVM